MLRAMSRLALVFLAACGVGTGVDGPRGPDIVRLVECVPAQPLFVEVDGRVTSHGRLDGEGMGWAGSGGVRVGDRVRRAASMSFGMPSTSGMMDAMVIRRQLSAHTTALQR